MKANELGGSRNNGNEGVQTGELVMGVEEIASREFNLRVELICLLSQK